MIKFRTSHENSWAQVVYKILLKKSSRPQICYSVAVTPVNVISYVLTFAEWDLFSMSPDKWGWNRQGNASFSLALDLFLVLGMLEYMNITGVIFSFSLLHDFSSLNPSCEQLTPLSSSTCSVGSSVWYHLGSLCLVTRQKLLIFKDRIPVLVLV